MYSGLSWKLQAFMDSFNHISAAVIMSSDFTVLPVRNYLENQTTHNQNDDAESLWQKREGRMFRSPYHTLSKFTRFCRWM